MAEEDRWDLEPTREPDPGFLHVAHAWCAGRPLDEVLEDEELLTGGDFVRNMRQLVDLLRQLADAAPEPATRAAARRAATELHRGVVAASSIVVDGDEEDG
ncbi:MAG: hypothetical protein U5R31_04495 [Acidimicrobiia bacterium]|nr:hypothetical protein [Acidimicrobiia bacterium]